MSDDVVSPTKFYEEFVNATREAELGLATCRKCKRKGPFEEFITVLYDNGLVYAMCLDCANAGHTILIKRGPLGIEVLCREMGPVVAVGGVKK